MIIARRGLPGKCKYHPGCFPFWNWKHFSLRADSHDVKLLCLLMEHHCTNIGWTASIHCDRHVCAAPSYSIMFWSLDCGPHTNIDITLQPTAGARFNMLYTRNKIVSKHSQSRRNHLMLNYLDCTWLYVVTSGTVMLSRRFSHWILATLMDVRICRNHMT